MSLTGVLLGLLDILVIVLILLLVGAICQWVLGSLGWPPPQQVQKIFMAIVALIALIMIISLLLGAPRVRILAAHVPAVATAYYA